MKRPYNQCHELRTRKREFNPDFWEVPVEWQDLCRFSEQQGLWHETLAEAEQRLHPRSRVNDVMRVIRKLMDEVLTERQRDIVCLYFFEQKTQYEVAELLGISVSSVSQHLFGKRRAGTLIGGAIPKLRKPLVQCGEARLSDVSVHPQSSKVPN